MNEEPLFVGTKTCMQHDRMWVQSDHIDAGQTQSRREAIIRTQFVLLHIININVFILLTIDR